MQSFPYQMIFKVSLNKYAPHLSANAVRSSEHSTTYNRTLSAPPLGVEACAQTSLRNYPMKHRRGEG